MPHFSANLSMLFTELPFLERFVAARKSGFSAVEFMFPYDFALDALLSELSRNRLKLALFNLPAGNWTEGDRGIAVHPERREEFRAGVDKAVAYARALGTNRVNCLVGKRVDGFSLAEQRAVLMDNLRFAAAKLEGQGIKLLIEPVNHFDIPGFFLNKTEEALRIISEANHPNLYLQYDLYHAQREEGELRETLRAHITRMENIQIADNPGRHQPGTGEINYRLLLSEIDKLGYSGYVSLEYVPLPDSVSSLKWMEDFGYRQA